MAVRPANRSLKDEKRSALLVLYVLIFQIVSK